MSLYSDALCYVNSPWSIDIQKKYVMHTTKRQYNDTNEASSLTGAVVLIFKSVINSPLISQEMRYSYLLKEIYVETCSISQILPYNSGLRFFTPHTSRSRKLRS